MRGYTKNCDVKDLRRQHTPLVVVEELQSVNNYSIFYCISMSVMELAEVVSPHFAVPVVGVVLCAVLVFAFGFKSSVQPPSFDFEKDEKHRLRQKAHRKPKVLTILLPLLLT